MEKIINIIKNKNWEEILNFSKVLTEEERFSTISLLKELDINRDILKKEGSELIGQERNDFYENRKQLDACLNYFLITCVRNYDEFKKIETKHEFFTSNPYYSYISTNNFEPLVNFYKLFPPHYLDKVIKEISKERFRNINFKILWKFYENNWIEFDEEFFVRSLFTLQGFDNNHFDDAEFLLEHSELIKKVFCKFYKYEIPILDSIKANSIDYSNGLSAKAHVYWTEVFKILIKNNAFANRSIVAHLLASLLNNWKKPHLDWHVRLLELFHPTKEELIANQSILFSVLGTGQTSLINYVVLNIKTIYANKEFDTLLFVQNVPIIFSNDKTVKSILIVMEIIENVLSNSFKIALDYRENLCLLFMQSEAKIQEKTAKILINYFDDKDLVTIVSPFLPNLKKVAKDILKVNDLASENFDAVIAEKKSFKKIAPISNWDELLFQIGTCIRTKSIIDIELFLDGIIQLQSTIPSDYVKQIKPYTKSLFNKFHESDTLTAFTLFLESWTIKNDEGFSKMDFKYIPFLGKKAKMTFLKLKDKNTLPFISTPTHEPFFVHPEILLERLLQYENSNAKVDLEDLIVACNRILITELDADFSKGVKNLKGYYSDAIRYFLGVSSNINFTNETLPLWTQITRIKNPYGNFPEFGKSKASSYPSVVEPFNVGFNIEKDANEYATWYRLILDNNWNYTWYNKEKTLRQETIYYNTASAEKASRVDIGNQFSLNPNYLDALLCRYIPNTATGNEVSGFEECLYPMQFILEHQLLIHHSGWLYVAVCLLFEKKISRDLASEYINLAITRNENLDEFAKKLSKLINEKFAPINRLIEYLDKPNHSKETKHFQFLVLSNCIKNFDKQNLPTNSKKVVQYYKELQNDLKLDVENEIEERIIEIKK
ncbi:DUF6493 family protein [Flavobacterium ustbae]|uniref:DUF6493 family protein n=1 Tax=Flavobacterium ustbae TaxID=2488790 RepID=UPI000F795613|nr:DUF6493 family protein [Flavobacterium ustbae]